jgi:leader peptidase (prepilin peptidase)/N-methyltransferase
MTGLGALAMAAILGAVIGSFLNVCIYRLPRGKSIVRPPSACPQCGRQLSWSENIPIVSYLVLRGRCRTCQAHISLRYPLVELVTALTFAAAWLAYGPTPCSCLGCCLLAR